MSFHGGTSLRVRAGAFILSAASAAVFMLSVATAAEALSTAGGVLAPAADGLQPTERVASMVETSGGSPSLKTAAVVVASTEKVADGAAPAALSPRHVAQVPQASAGASGAALDAPEVLVPVASGSPASPGTPAAETSMPAVISTPRAPEPDASSAIATLAVVAITQFASTHPAVAASSGAIMLERQGQAETLTASWLPLTPREQQGTAIALTPNLRIVIAQFQSLARDNPTLGAGAVPPQLAGASTQELGSVLLRWPLSTAAGPGTRSVALGDLSGVWRARASNELSAGAASIASSERFAPVRRALRHASVGTAAESGTISGLISGAGAALGGGATGLAAPAAALLALAAACMLATVMLGQLALDPFVWKSTLLSLRLERPG
jgi:hypothetical protein